MAEKRLIDAMQTVIKMSGRITPLIQMGANPTQVYNEVLQVVAEAPTVDVVELPCKVGDTVYQVDANKIYPITIKNLIYDAGHIAFDENAIGKSVFLTRKEAEAKLGGDGNG